MPNLEALAGRRDTRSCICFGCRGPGALQISNSQIKTKGSSFFELSSLDANVAMLRLASVTYRDSRNDFKPTKEVQLI